MNTTKHTLPLCVGGKYNWRGQPERLIYMGARRYPGDVRPWHQFAKVDAPDVCWCEVLASDLVHFEQSDAAATQEQNGGAA